MPRYRLTLINDRTGRPVDTRICNRLNRGHVEDFCAYILPRVAHAKGIDVTDLRGEIKELIPATSSDAAIPAALLST